MWLNMKSFRQNKNRRFWKRSVLKYYSFLSFVVHLRDLFFSERLHLIFAWVRAPGSVRRDGSSLIGCRWRADRQSPKTHTVWVILMVEVAVESEFGEGLDVDPRVYSPMEHCGVRWSLLHTFRIILLKDSNPSLIRKFKRFETLRTLF